MHVPSLPSPLHIKPSKNLAHQELAKPYSKLKMQRGYGQLVSSYVLQAAPESGDGVVMGWQSSVSHSTHKSRSQRQMVWLLHCASSA